MTGEQVICLCGHLGVRHDLSAMRTVCLVEHCSCTQLRWSRTAAPRTVEARAVDEHQPSPVFVLSDVIECAAELVDNGTEVDDEYRRGVVELAARICLPGHDVGDAVTVMAFAVCGVNRPSGGATDV